MISSNSSTEETGETAPEMVAPDPAPRPSRRTFTAARDAGALSGLGDARRSVSGSKVATKGEVERLHAQNVRLTAQLSQTRTALDIMGKAHVLLEMLSESTDTSTRPRRS